MKIAIIVDWHSEGMGYSHNFLPKELAALGHEVHLITSTAQVYATHPNYQEIFGKFLGPAYVEPLEKKKQGYTLHRLPVDFFLRRVRISGLLGKLLELRPDVIQVGEGFSFLIFESLLAKILLGNKLFIECHVHKSVFPVAQGKGGKKATVYWNVYPFTIGLFVSLFTRKCFAIGADCAEIAIRYLGFRKSQVVVRSLGTDTGLFLPKWEVPKDVLAAKRRELNIPEDAFVCVYTGRLAAEKNPLCLAQAVDILQKKNRKVYGLFVGDGNAAYADQIARTPNCRTVSFVKVDDLPIYYQIADLAVWPRQESTSQLDALSVGLPLVLSDRIHLHERIDGTGLLYREDDAADLAEKIEALIPEKTREPLAKEAATRARRLFSWRKIAEDYVQDYQR